MIRNEREVKELLDEAYDRLAHPGFVANDPIQIPRSFARREDAELIGFLTATIAWGQRQTIIANAKRMVSLMDEAPLDFVLNASINDLSRLDRFMHRTFNGIDLRHFILGLRHLNTTHGGLENAFLQDGRVMDMAGAIALFRTIRRGAAMPSASTCSCAGWCGLRIAASIWVCGRRSLLQSCMFRWTCIQGA